MLDYGINFNVEEGKKKALKEIEDAGKEFQKLLDKNKLKVNFKPEDFNMDEVLKKVGTKASTLKIPDSIAESIKNLRAEFRQLTIEETKAGRGQELLDKYRNLKNEAGIYAGTLDQAVKAQDKMTAAAGKSVSAIDSQTKAYKRQSDILVQLKSYAMNFLSVYGGIRLTKSMIDITGEFEAQRISLQAILRDAQKGEAIFEKIKTLAVISPYTFKDLVGYTKQLSAFSVPYNELYETTKMLADVSAGLGVDMSRIILAYGQVRSAAVLRGQELRQFTEAGIPLIDELAKKFTELNGRVVEAGEVFDLIGQRKVSFEMVKDIFSEMSSEGGKFYNMQEKLADTLKGKVANLTDAFQIMMSEIGEKGSGILKGAIDSTRWLMENYERTGKLVVGLIATYGAYRATIIATVAVQNGFINTQLATGVALAKLKKSFDLLTATMIKNPYALVVTAAVGLIATLWALRDETTEEEKAQKRVAEQLKITADRKDELSRRSSQLINILKSETATLYQQVEAYKALKNILPEKYKNYTFDQLKNVPVNELTKASEEERTNRYISERNKLYEDTERKVKNLTDRESELKKQIEAIKEVHGGIVAYRGQEAQELIKVQSELAKATADLKEYKKDARDIADTQKQTLYAANPYTQKRDLEDQLAKFKEVSDELEKQKKLAEEAGVWNPNITIELDAVNARMKKINEQLIQVNHTTGKQVETREILLSKYKEEQKALKDIQEEYNKGRADASQVQDIKDKLAATKTALELGGWTEAKAGKDKTEKNIDLEIKKMMEDRILAVRAAELEISQARIDMMDEGFAKEQKQIDHNHNKELLSIQKRTQELIREQQEIEKKEWEKAGGKGMFNPTTNSFSKLPLAQQSELNDRYDIAWAAYRNNQAKNLKSLLDQYRTYEQQRIDINKKFDTDVKAIKGQNLADEKERLRVLEKQRKDAIKSINATETAETEKSSQLFIKLFSDSSRISTARIKEITAEAKKLVDYLSGVSKTLPSGFSESQLEAMKTDPEKIKAIYDALIQKQDELDSRTNYPFSNIIKGFENWKKAAENTAKANKEANEETKRYLLNEADAMRAKGLEYIKGGAVEAAEELSKLVDLMQELADASGDSRFSEFVSQMGALGENISAAGKGFQQGGWIGAIIGGAQNMLEQTIASFVQSKAEQKEFEQNRLDFLDAYNLKLLEIDGKDYDTIFGSSGLEKAREASIKAQEALAKYYELIKKTTSPETQKEFRSLGAAIFGGLHFGSWIGLTKSLSNESKVLLDSYKKGYTDIQSMAIKTKDYSGWSNFWGKKDKYMSLKDLAPGLWGSNGEFNVDAAQAFLDTNTQINAEQRKAIQGVIDMKAAYESNLEIIRDDLQDTFGNLGGSLMDSLENAIRTGADMWDVFRQSGEQSIEGLGRKIAYELFFADKFAKLQESLEQTYGLGDTEAIANKQKDLLSQFFNTIGKDMESAKVWLEKWQEEAKKQGFDIYKNEGEGNLTGISKNLSQMSEDTALVLEGTLNSMRLKIFEYYDYMKNNIHPAMGQMLLYGTEVIANLQAIALNTRETADNTRLIADSARETADNTKKIQDTAKKTDERLDSIIAPADDNRGGYAAKVNT